MLLLLLLLLLMRLLSFYGEEEEEEEEEDNFLTIHRSVTAGSTNYLPTCMLCADHTVLWEGGARMVVD